LTPSLESRAKRHYLGVSVASSPEGFLIELDGRVVKTPAGRRMVLPTGALAGLVAEEWKAQKDVIDFETMPATRLARAAIDALPDVRGDLVKRVVEYAGDDLLCYFADAPPELVRRQQASWVPILSWAEDELGQAIRQSSGVIHQDQTLGLIAAVERKAMTIADLDLIGVTSAAQLFGSAFLALALHSRRLNGAGAFAASRIDETFQAETWGEDPEAASRARAIELEAQMLERWFAALS
jgi:chaperone required for assembly of F1-ATPase